MNGLSSLDGMTVEEERRERLSALQDELKYVLERKAALETQLHLLRNERAPEQTKHGGVRYQQQPLPAPTSSLKRGASSLPEPSFGTSHPLKQQKSLQQKAKELEGVWSLCGTILKEIMKPKDAYNFMSPVDPVRQNVPDYFTIVKKPMDLGTIKKKLEHKPDKDKPRKYQDVYQFRDDVRLVWNNCRLYNPVGNIVRTLGDRLSDLWEKKWREGAVETKWEEAVARQQEEDEEVAPEGSWRPLHKKMTDMDSKLRQLTSKAEQQQPPHTSRGPSREMTFAEKRTLSERLETLPGQNLQRIMEIVAEHSKIQSVDDVTEIELDIDMLDNETLWRLDAFVDSVLSGKGTAPKAGFQQQSVKSDDSSSSSEGG